MAELMRENLLLRSSDTLIKLSLRLLTMLEMVDFSFSYFVVLMESSPEPYCFFVGSSDATASFKVDITFALI